MSTEQHTKVIRIIARLNVGGPAKHVVWLTAGLKDAGFDTLLVTGQVPEGEEDMSYFADESGVKPLYFSEMSREISLKDAVTVWKLFRLYLRERPDIVHTHTAKAGTVGRTAGFLYRWLTPGVFISRNLSVERNRDTNLWIVSVRLSDPGAAADTANFVADEAVAAHLSRSRLSQLLRACSNANVSRG